MIIWISSYPRSGNTLLRTILQESFGIASLDSEISSTFSSKELEKKRASRSVYFVKTHSCNYAEDKAIYILRDGRRSIYSYYKWFKSYFPDEQRTLLEIIFGVDSFHSWSEHIEYWLPVNGDRLILSYNDLQSQQTDFLERISAFIEKPIIKDWKNNKVVTNTTGGFREGKTAWTGEPEWGDLEDKLFWLIHGKTMRSHGFGSGPDLNPELEIFMEEIAKGISPRIRDLYNTRNQLQSMMDKSMVARLKKLIKRLA